MSGFEFTYPSDERSAAGLVAMWAVNPDTLREDTRKPEVGDAVEVLGFDAVGTKADMVAVALEQATLICHTSSDEQERFTWQHARDRFPIFNDERIATLEARLTEWAQKIVDRPWVAAHDFKWSTPQMEQAAELEMRNDIAGRLWEVSVTDVSTGEKSEPKRTDVTVEIIHARLLRDILRLTRNTRRNAGTYGMMEALDLEVRSELYERMTWDIPGLRDTDA